MPWYAIETKPGRIEWLRAVVNLENQGFEVYAPLCREAEADPSDAKPLFPWYAFVAIDPARGGWADVRYTPGVVDLLRPAPEQRPSALRPGVIEGLRGLEVGGVIPLAPRFRSGQGLRIVRGPFAGHEGIVSRKAGRRIHAMLRLFGAQRAVELAEGDVEPVGAAA